MYSIRKNGVKLVLASAAMIVVAAGCQRIVPDPISSPVNDAPLVVDEAMQIRDYDRTTSYYANGQTVAGGTAYVWQTHETIKEADRKFVDAPVALLNFVSMPVGLFVNSPFKAQVYRGETVPPTYTGQPPLPGKPIERTSTGVEVIDTPAPTNETVPPPADGSLPPPAPAIETTPPAPPANEATPVTPPTPPSTEVTPPTPPSTEVVPPTPPVAPEAPVTPAPETPAPVTPPAPEPITPDSTPTTPAPVTPGAVESVPPVAPPAPAEPAAPAPAPESTPATTTPLNK